MLLIFKLPCFKVIEIHGFKNEIKPKNTYNEKQHAYLLISTLTPNSQLAPPYCLVVSSYSSFVILSKLCFHCYYLPNTQINLLYAYQKFCQI